MGLAAGSGGNVLRLNGGHVPFGAIREVRDDHRVPHTRVAVLGPRGWPNGQSVILELLKVGTNLVRTDTARRRHGLGNSLQSAVRLEVSERELHGALGLLERCRNTAGTLASSRDTVTHGVAVRKGRNPRLPEVTVKGVGQQDRRLCRLICSLVRSGPYKTPSRP